jgi:hypothetical protein
VETGLGSSHTGTKTIPVTMTWEYFVTSFRKNCIGATFAEHFEGAAGIGVFNIRKYMDISEENRKNFYANPSRNSNS